jgi:hypothetical protein
MRLSPLGQLKSKWLPRQGWRWLASFLSGCLVIGLAPSMILAQYRFDNWTTEQGLPQNSVLAIAQTADGYLWLATYNGLVRFDGMRFTVYDKNNTPAFKTSRFHDLFADAAGALWLSVEEGGVIRYQNGVFTPLATEQGLPSNTVLNLQSAPDGALLISTSGGAIWWRNERIAPYEASAFRENVKVYLGPSGTHWSIDKNGLHERDKNGRVNHYAVPAEPKFIMNARMLEDRSGALWVAPPRYGLFRVKDGVERPGHHYANTGRRGREFVVCHAQCRFASFQQQRGGNRHLLHHHRRSFQQRHSRAIPGSGRHVVGRH